MHIAILQACHIVRTATCYGVIMPPGHWDPPIRYGLEINRIKRFDRFQQVVLNPSVICLCSYTWSFVAGAFLQTRERPAVRIAVEHVQDCRRCK